jgi:hypothetical protein
MKQTTEPKSPRASKATEPVRSRPGPQTVAPTGNLAQLAAMVNSSPRQRALLQLTEDLQNRPRVHSLFRPSEINRGAPALQRSVPVNDDASLEREVDVMGAKALAIPAQQEEVPEETVDASPVPIQLQENAAPVEHLAHKVGASQENMSTVPTATQPPVQRKVLVKGKLATQISRSSALVDGKRVDLGSRSAEWVTDGYTRSYKSTEEFKAHVRGEPVDVGLAKKLGLWYRLHFFSDKQFFVLGENHGAFGYRELIKESNQPGKVLGEGGANPLHSATASSPLQPNPKGLKDESGLPRESLMEHVGAKAYYGLTLVRAHCEKMIKPGATNGPTAPIKLPEKEWLVKYQSAPPEKRKTGTGLNRLPYYEDSGNKVYATFGTKAEDYNPLNTAFNVVKELDDAIEAKYKDIETPGGLQQIRGAIARITEIKAKEPIDYDALIKKADRLLKLLKMLASAEAKKLNAGIDPEDELEERRAKVKEHLPKYTEHQQEAFAYRDYAMYKSILKGRRDHVMAGIGDHHAKNLKDALTAEGIPVVLFEEFTGSSYSSDAIAPLEESAGFEQKVAEAEKGKDQFLANLYFRLIHNLSTQGPAAIPPSSAFLQKWKVSLPPGITPQMRGLLKEITQSPQYHKSSTIAPSFFRRFLRIQSNASGDIARTGDEARVTTLTAPLLLQVRKAVEGIFVVPSSSIGGTGKELVVRKTQAPQAISLADVFDRFLELGRSAGAVQFKESTTLQEILAQIRHKMKAGDSRALVVASQRGPMDQRAAELDLILTLTALGQTTVGSILKLVKRSQGQRRVKGNLPRHTEQERALTRARIPVTFSEEFAESDYSSHAQQAIVGSDDPAGLTETEPLLSQARKAVEGIFVVPGSSTGSTGKELVTLKAQVPRAISLAGVFDRFLKLGRLVGGVEFTDSTTLQEILDQIKGRMKGDNSKALVAASQNRPLNEQAGELAAILRLTVLGQTTIGTILELVKSRQSENIKETV